MNTLLSNKIVASTSAAIVALAMGFAAQQVKATNILGIDVYEGQGSINWTSVKGGGVDFAFAKATEGTYYEDPDFKANMVNGKKAGVYMGAYDFCRPDLYCPATEANYFWAFAGAYIIKDGKSLDPMVDFETFNGVDCEANYTAWLNAWSADVQAKTSNFMHPVVYCSACSGACDLIEYNDAGGITLSAWIADYNGEDLYTGNPWSSCDCCNAWVTGCSTANWTYWQVSSTGAIPGISGDCDLDAYPDSVADLEAYQGVGN